MPDRAKSGRQVCFEEFRFDLGTHELWRGTVPVSLPPTPSCVLATLVERPGQLLTRDELYRAAWNNRIVSFDLALNTAIRQVRRALGDDADSPRFIQTLARRGYRFVAEVRAVAPPQGSEGPAVGRTLRRWQTAVGIGVAAVLGFATALSFAMGPGPTVEVTSVVHLDPRVNPTIGAVLEQRIRSTVAQEAGHALTVMAPRGDIDDIPDPADYAIRGSLYTTVSGSPRFDVQLVRTADGAIIWSGWFNPECPRVADPGGAIARYLSRVVLTSAT